ncbi:MAG: hypothetical protein Q8R91_05530 [Candidatus Omnitrophota bacterium]|nr:hypothetical protein [Candidatus Omnitrophota bacterium]
MILLVTYDLKSPSTEYLPLYEYLKTQDNWMHYIASTWLIKTSKTPNEIVDGIKPHLREGDHVMVVKFDRPYQGWMPKRAWEWIDAHKDYK